MKFIQNIVIVFVLVLSFLPFNSHAMETGYKSSYAVLEVGENAEWKEVTKAYRKLAKKWHPDKNRGNEKVAEVKMKQINNAYDEIKLIESRKPKQASQGVDANNLEEQIDKCSSLEEALIIIEDSQCIEINVSIITKLEKRFKQEEKDKLLYSYVVCQNLELIKILLNIGASDSNKTRTLLHRLVGGDDARDKKIMETLLLAYNARNLLNGYIDKRDDRGRTPLHVAALCHDTEAMQLLLNCGACIETFDDRGSTPLHSAIITYVGDPLKTKEAVKCLIEKGAKCDERGENGNTPLHLAASYADKDIVKMLIDAGADIYKRNEENETPFSLAKRSESLKGVKIWPQNTNFTLGTLYNTISSWIKRNPQRAAVFGVGVGLFLAAGLRTCLHDK